MATFRSASTANATHVNVAGTSLVINKPTGVVNGDSLILVCNVFNVTATAAANAITGWVQVLAAASGMSMWVRTASSEPASYTIVIPSSQQVYDICAIELAYSGTVAELDGHNPRGFNAALNNLTSQALAALGDDFAVPITAGASDTTLAFYAPTANGVAEGTLTGPAGWSTRATAKSTSANGVGLIVADKLTGNDHPTASASTAQQAWRTLSYTILGLGAPVAAAGVDQSVFEGHTVSLSGSGSTDPNGAGLTYAWTVTSDGGTGLTTGSLTGASTATASFTAPTVGSNSNIVLTLKVTDARGLSSTDTVTVTVKPSTVLANVTGAGGLLIGGPATVTPVLIDILVNKTGVGGLLIGPGADIDPSLINILIAATGAGGLLFSGVADMEFVQETVQPVETFRTPPTFEVSLAARTPAASGAPPTLAEVDRLVVDSIQYTDELNRPGSALLGVPVRSLSDPVKVRLADLAAHPCEVRIYYDGELQWAGEVQTISIQDQVAQLGCVGLLGYVYRMGVVSDLTYTGVDQFTIAKALVDQWQALDYGNYGLDTSGISTSGVTRDHTYLRDDLNNVGQRLEELAAAVDGFDYHVDPATRDLVLSYPARGTDLTETVVLDERNIDSAQIAVSVGPDDLVTYISANGTTQATGGDGAQLRTDRFLITRRTTYGLSWNSATFDNVDDQDTLEDHASAYLLARQNQLLQPGATLFSRPGTRPGDFHAGDVVAYSFDAGLGIQSGSFRVASVQVTVDNTGALRLTVEFV